ncbi:MAG: hypothetical protein QG604_758 [Candidatus Dependentiae bacterium]|nr:hypothetical protein [Candidatus Dependentiae bacterium]
MILACSCALAHGLSAADSPSSVSGELTPSLTVFTKEVDYSKLLADMTVVARHVAEPQAATNLSEVAEGVFMQFEQYGFMRAVADLRFKDEELLAVVRCLTGLCVYFPEDDEKRAALIKVITRLVVARCGVDEHDVLAMLTEVLTLRERWQLVLDLEWEYRQSDSAYRTAGRCSKSSALTKLLGIARAYKREFQACMVLQYDECQRTGMRLTNEFTKLTTLLTERVMQAIVYINGLLAEVPKKV